MKKLALCIIAVMLLSLLSVTSFAAPTPYAHYTFDDAANLGLDSVGGHNGTPDGGAATEGKFGTALLLDGASCIEVTTEDKLDKFTLATWARLDSNNGGYNSILAVSQWSVAGTLHLNILCDTKTELGISDATFSAGRVSNYLVTEGEWVHITVTYDTTTGEANLYYNGELDVTTVADAPSAPIDLYDFFIGCWDFDRYFTGALDDMRIYNAILTQDEIKTVMAGDPAPVVEEAPAVEETPAVEEAPAAEAAPVVEEAPVVVTPAAQTSDLIVLAIGAMLTASTAFIAKKKR